MAVSLFASAPPTWPMSPSPLITTGVSPASAPASASLQPCSTPSVSTRRYASPRSRIPASSSAISSRALPPPAEGFTSSRWRRPFAGHGENLVVAVVTPKTRYARSGEYSIAYQVVGEGDLDLVYMPGFASNLEVFWEEPRYSRFLHRLASFSRLILIDRLGTGLSDRAAAGRGGDPRAARRRHRRGDGRRRDRARQRFSDGRRRRCPARCSPPPIRSAPRPSCSTAGCPSVLERDDFPYGASAEGYDDFMEGSLEIWPDGGLLRLWAPEPRRGSGGARLVRALPAPLREPRGDEGAVGSRSRRRTCARSCLRSRRRRCSCIAPTTR